RAAVPAEARRGAELLQPGRLWFAVAAQQGANPVHRLGHLQPLRHAGAAAAPGAACAGRHTHADTRADTHKYTPFTHTHTCYTLKHTQTDKQMLHIQTHSTHTSSNAF